MKDQSGGTPGVAHPRSIILFLLVRDVTRLSKRRSSSKLKDRQWKLSGETHVAVALPVKRPQRPDEVDVERLKAPRTGLLNHSQVVDMLSHVFIIALDGSFVDEDDRSVLLIAKLEMTLQLTDP